MTVPVVLLSVLLSVSVVANIVQFSLIRDLWKHLKGEMLDAVRASVRLKTLIPIAADWRRETYKAAGLPLPAAPEWESWTVEESA